MSVFNDVTICRRNLLKTGAALGASTPLYPPAGVFAISDHPVKMGMIGPETGTYAALGGGEIAGAKLAVDEIKAKGVSWGTRCNRWSTIVRPLWANPCRRRAS